MSKNIRYEDWLDDQMADLEFRAAYEELDLDHRTACLRMRLALYRYEHEEISVGKAAALAGVSWAQMIQTMAEQGIQPRLGPETIEEAEEEVNTLRQLLGRK